MKDLSNFEILRLPENASTRQVVSQYKKIQQAVANEHEYWLQTLSVYKKVLEGTEVSPQEFDRVGMGYNPSLSKVSEVYQSAKNKYFEYRTWLTHVEIAVNELAGAKENKNEAIIEEDSKQERTLHLAILHLDENASEEDIKNAYEQNKNQFLMQRTGWNTFLEKFDKEMLSRILPVDLTGPFEDEISVGNPPAYQDPPEYTQEEVIPGYNDVIRESFQPILAQVFPVRRREKTPRERRADYMETDRFKSDKDEYIKRQMHHWEFKETREAYKKSRDEFKQIEIAYNHLTHDEYKIYDESVKRDLQTDLTFASSEIPEDFLQSLQDRHANSIINSANPHSEINMLYSYAAVEREILEGIAGSDEEIQKLTRTFEGFNDRLSPPQTFLKGLTKETFRAKLNPAPLPADTSSSLRYDS